MLQSRALRRSAGVGSTFLIAALVAAVLALCPRAVLARNVDTSDDSELVGRGKFFRLDYANDFFTGTDRYYTQGIGFRWFDPVLKRSPLMGVLARLPAASDSYGLVVRHSGFTPSSYLFNQALLGDRPFAATFFLGHELVSRDDVRRLTLTTELDLGVIGQAAGGKWLQTTIHRNTGNQRPLGWDNQIRNDVVADYYARLEKRLLSSRFADAGVYGDATAGTLYDNLAAGLMGRSGAIDGARRRRVFLFGRSEARLVGYDATLQGGLTNRGSPYTLTAARVRRVVLRADIGFTVDCPGFAVEATRTFLSREFTDGLSHQWVEISFVKRY